MDSPTWSNFMIGASPFRLHPLYKSDSYYINVRLCLLSSTYLHKKLPIIDINISAPYFNMITGAFLLRLRPLYIKVTQITGYFYEHSYILMSLELHLLYTRWTHFAFVWADAPSACTYILMFSTFIMPNLFRNSSSLSSTFSLYSEKNIVTGDNHQQYNYLTIAGIN